MGNSNISDLELANLWGDELSTHINEVNGSWLRSNINKKEKGQS